MDNLIFAGAAESAALSLASLEARQAGRPINL
jgi:hypothetical protein